MITYFLTHKDFPSLDVQAPPLEITYNESTLHLRTWFSHGLLYCFPPNSPHEWSVYFRCPPYVNNEIDEPWIPLNQPIQIDAEIGAPK